MLAGTSRAIGPARDHRGDFARRPVCAEWRQHPAVACVCARRRNEGKVSAALLDAHRTARDAHVSEYKYYATDLPRPMWGDDRNLVGFSTDRSASPKPMSRPVGQTAKNYTFFGAPVGLIVTIDRRLEVGSWLDLGMFVQNVLLAAAGHGFQSCPQETFSKYHKILRSLLSIPEEQMVVCGISIGCAKGETTGG